MTGTPARGPQAVTRRDGTTANSTGLVHTWCIRAADKMRSTRTVHAGTTDTPTSDAYQRALTAANTGR